MIFSFFFFQAEAGIRDKLVTGVQTGALPIFDEAGEAGVTVHYVGVGRARVDPLPDVFGSQRSKIGRASCRERVEIGVVSVYVKKKSTVHYQVFGFMPLNATVHVPTVVAPGTS